MLAGKPPAQPPPRVTDFEELDKKAVDVLVDALKYIATTAGIIIAMYSQSLREFLKDDSIAAAASPAKLLLFFPILSWFAAVTGTVLGIYPRQYLASTDHAKELAIRKIRVGDAIPIEGAITFIRVKRPSGRVVLTRRLPASDRLTLPLRPGRYRLVSWQRLCDGNCGTLDPPSDRCARSLTITAGERLTATIRVNYAVGCVIRLRR